MKRTIAGLVILMALGGPNQLVKADTYIDYTYDVTLSGGISTVTNPIYVYPVAGGGFDIGIGRPPIIGGSPNIVLKDITPPFEAGLAVLPLGLVTGVPGDPGTTLAILGNFAPGEIGQSFSSLFPDANESAVINDLENVFDNASLSATVLDTAFNDDILPLFNDANALGLPIAISGNVGTSNFDIVAFSTGQLIGTGTLTEFITPEPPSVILMSAILLAVPFLARKRFAGSDPPTRMNS
jgi:hypothetical protein